MHASPRRKAFASQAALLDHQGRLGRTRPSAPHLAEVQLPQEPPAARPSTSQEQSQHRMSKCTDAFLSCLQRCSKVCQLFQTLQHSKNSASHVSQLLANFSPNTLERYLKAVTVSLTFTWQTGIAPRGASRHSCRFHVRFPAFCPTGQSNTSQSPIISIKALRWWAKQCTWQELAVAMHSPLVNAYAKDTQCKDTQEAIPIPLAVITAWERAVCDN